MKQAKLVYTLFCVAMIFMAHSSVRASANVIGLQDIYIFGQITNVTESIDINDQMITYLSDNSTGINTLSGGVNLTSTSITGRISDVSSGAIRNTDGFVNMGILEFDGNQNIIAIASTRITADKALGIDFNVELDLTGVNDIQVGDTISQEYISLRTYSTVAESMENNPFSVFTNRIQGGSFTATGLFQDGVQDFDEDLLAMSFSTSEIIAGSTFWRYFGKGLEAASWTVGGALTGAGVGTAVGPIGTLGGAIIGGTGGLLQGVGSALKDNNEIDPVIPSIPEPSTYALMLGGLGLVGFMAYRRQEKQKK